MKKISKAFTAVLCAFVVSAVVITGGWTSSRAFGEDTGALHTSKSTPTQSLMRVISAHTSKILDALMAGDFNAVARESNAVAENSEIIMEMFYTDEGDAGEWFKPDEKNPESAEKIKAEFEKYMRMVVDSSRNIAESAAEKNIVETYKSFDAMLQSACFGCHEVSRAAWPDWPDFMRQAGG